MKTFNAFFLTVALATSCNALAKPTDVDTVKKSLKPWQPLEVSKSKDKITVVLDTNEVTDEIYNAVIMSGICMDIWTHDVPPAYLKSVNEMQIVNKHKAFGYVLEQPLATCNEVGKESGDRAKVMMFAKTHMFGMQKSK